MVVFVILTLLMGCLHSPFYVEGIASLLFCVDDMKGRDGLVLE